MLFSNYPRLRSLLRKSPRWVVGVAVATPAVALLQGASLLLHYRENFHDSPYPITPSQGVVVSRKEASLFSSIDDEQPPLRILVIGDSLAAGVGVLQSATPVLPESMAKVLSHKLGGRPVYWTCIGQPGASLPEIIQQIHANHEMLVVRQDSTIVPRKSMVQQKVEEQADQFIERRKRLRYWWQHERQLFRQQQQQQSELEQQSISEESTVADEEGKSNTPLVTETSKQEEEEEETTNDNPPRGPIAQWWDNLKSDFRSFQHAWQGPTPDEVAQQHKKQQLAQQQQQSQDPFALWQKWKRRLIRQESSLEEPIGQYDIAVVMTGANDLKQAWLPFMFTNNNKNKTTNSTTNDNDDSTTDKTMPDRFRHVLEALKSKMELVLDQQNDDKQIPEMVDHDEHTAMVEYHDTSSDNHPHPRRHPPLVVFPAMPVSMVPDFHKPPMSWFIFWMFQRLEHYKRAIAQQFPGEVVFVEAPPRELFVSKKALKEEEKGQPAEEVLVAITNVRERVKERMNQTLQDYRRKWAELMTEEEGYDDNDKATNTNGTTTAAASLEIMDQGENNDGDFGHHPDESYMDYDKRGRLERTKSNHSKRSPVLSIDQLHPNDRGYEIWGQHIAEHVLEKWNADS